jgi:hypothetical protein
MTDNLSEMGTDNYTKNGYDEMFKDDYEDEYRDDDRAEDERNGSAGIFNDRPWMKGFFEEDYEDNGKKEILGKTTQA